MVGRSFMRKLHRDFMDDPTDTDVLAFPTENGGDIAICAPVAAANARRFNEPPARELLRLIVHGSLHLLGYKDEPAREQKKMWKKQETLVGALWTR
jgi:rRNA maturation RNase YbeY